MATLLGNSVKFSVAFKDEDGALYDPDAVSFELTLEGGDTATYEPGDLAIVNDGVGLYHIWTLPDAAGDWTGKFIGLDNDGRSAAGCAVETITDDCAEANAS